MGARICAIAILITSLGQLAGDELSPVVAMRQPGGVAKQCNCYSCSIGINCRENPLAKHAIFVGDQLGEDEVSESVPPVIPETQVDLQLDIREVPGSDTGVVVLLGELNEEEVVGLPETSPVVACCTDSGCDPSCDANGMSPLPTCGAPDGCDEACCTAASCDDACLTGCDSVAGCCDAGGCDLPELDFGCMNLCCRQGFWIRADALVWWTNDNDIPALATSSPLGTAIGDAGVLGLPTTTTLLGGAIFDSQRPGGRIRFGWWADDCTHGLEGSFWGLQNDRDDFTWSSAGDPAYARPFFNVDPLVNAEDAQLISFDGVLDGTLNIRTSSELFGGDIGIRKNLMCCSDVCDNRSSRIDCYVGYRYFRFNEGIRIAENLESTALAGPVALGTTIDLFDDFRTRNEFHGANLGLIAMRQHGRLSAEVVGRVAFGNISRQVDIAGQTTVTVPGLAPNVTSGGLLARPTNIGTYEDDEFGVLPEVQFSLGYQLTCNTKFLVGYNFAYLGNLARPGDIIDSSVNGVLLDNTLPPAGPNRPRFDWNDSDTWVMGLSLGFAWNF